jgi:hypothetical protein
MPNCCKSNCPTKCGPCFLDTNIIFKDLSSCEGIFTFGPDSITVPGPCGLTGPNTEVCPLSVNVLKNCKGDYKVTLLDDDGCNLACLIVKCSQFQLTPISELDENVQALYEANLPTGFSTSSLVLQISANNLNLVGEYVSFEESAYFYREVCQAYLNLWCGAEKNGIICQIIENRDLIVSELSAESASAQFVYTLSQDLIKARVLALKQLCECGKVCNDQFFPQKYNNPCAALKGCCPKY